MGGYSGGMAKSNRPTDSRQIPPDQIRSVSIPPQAGYPEENINENWDIAKLWRAVLRFALYDIQADCVVEKGLCLKMGAIAFLCSDLAAEAMHVSGFYVNVREVKKLSPCEHRNPKLSKAHSLLLLGDDGE